MLGGRIRQTFSHAVRNKSRGARNHWVGPHECVTPEQRSWAQVRFGGAAEYALVGAAPPGTQNAVWLKSALRMRTRSLLADVGVTAVARNVRATFRGPSLLLDAAVRFASVLFDQSERYLP
jgi:hypothetical protein